MEITLEKIELVKDRTGVTYKEAKEALEGADGNVVDAIIAIEETIDQKSPKKLGASGEALVAKMKEIVKKGNVSKILVTRDGDTIVNIPLSVGVLGTVIAPWGMIASIVAAFGFKCKIELIKDDGSVIDITEKAGDIYEDAKEKGTDIYEDIKEKAPGVYEDIREKSGAAFAKAKDAAKDARERLKKDKTDDELNMEDVELYEKEEEPFGDADDWQDDTQKED